MRKVKNVWGQRKGDGGYVSHKGTEGSEAAGQARLAQRGNIFYFSFFSVCFVHSVVGHSFYHEKRTTEHIESTEMKPVALCSEYWIIMFNLYSPHVQFYLTGAHAAARLFVYRLNDAEGVIAGFCRFLQGDGAETSPPKSEETQGVWSLFADKMGFLHFLHHFVRVFLRNRDHPVD